VLKGLSARVSLICVNLPQVQFQFPQPTRPRPMANSPLFSLIAITKSRGDQRQSPVICGLENCVHFAREGKLVPELPRDMQAEGSNPRHCGVPNTTLNCWWSCFSTGLQYERVIKPRLRHCILNSASSSGRPFPSCGPSAANGSFYAKLEMLGFMAPYFLYGRSLAPTSAPGIQITKSVICFCCEEEKTLPPRVFRTVRSS